MPLVFVHLQDVDNPKYSLQLLVFVHQCEARPPPSPYAQKQHQTGAKQRKLESNEGSISAHGHGVWAWLTWICGIGT